MARVMTSIEDKNGNMGHEMFLNIDGRIDLSEEEAIDLAWTKAQWLRDIEYDTLLAGEMCLFVCNKGKHGGVRFDIIL